MSAREIPEKLKNVFLEMNRRLLNEDASPSELFCLSFNLSLKWHIIGNIEFCTDNNAIQFRYRKTRH